MKLYGSLLFLSVFAELCIGNTDNMIMESSNLDASNKLYAMEINEEAMYDPLPRRGKRSQHHYSTDEDACLRECVFGRCVFDNATNSVHCQCMIGYEGKNCSVRTLYCPTNAHLCQPNGQCIEQLGTHVCQCRDNIADGATTRFKYGFSCSVAVPNPCSEKDLEKEFKHLATRSFHPLVGSTQAYIQCVIDSFVVRRCPLDKQWDQETLSCISALTSTPKLGVCAREPCLNKGHCVQLGQNPNAGSKDFRCACLPPYKGRFCEQRLDMCHASNNKGILTRKQTGADENRCGPGSACINTDINPYFACVCDDSIITPFPCRYLSTKIINKCSENTKRYALYEKVNGHSLWVECDDDGVGFVKVCPINQRFRADLQTCA